MFDLNFSRTFELIRYKLINICNTIMRACAGKTPSGIIFISVLKSEAVEPVNLVTRYVIRFGF